MRNELHLVNAPNGHHMSSDCWCEPSRIYWVTNIHGITMLVVEHVDETLQHRTLVLAIRERDKHQASSNYHTDHDWITRVLNFPERKDP